MSKLIIKNNVTTQVTEYLKSQILQGVWAPGDRIDSENELCQTLNVSRSTIRAAIQQMIAIGVLESHQGKGTFLKSMMMDDIIKNLDRIYVNPDFDQLIEFRRIVEVASCRLAAQRIDENGLKVLKTCLESMEKNIENRDVFIRNDMQFHYEILKATGNLVIVKSLEKMGEEIHRQHERFNTAEFIAKAVYYHRHVYEALAARDGEMAALMMERHLTEVASPHS